MGRHPTCHRPLATHRFADRRKPSHARKLPSGDLLSPMVQPFISMEVRMPTIDHRIVSRDEWLMARKEFLKKEKEFSHLQDELSRQRRALPWVKIEKNYVFDTAEGKRSLADLFGDRSQLVLYHFMLHPDWQEGCTGCSFVMDNLPACMKHLEQKDLRFVVASRAPLEKINAYKERMGWDFNWVSSFGSDFNFDFGVSFQPEDVAKGSIYYNYRQEIEDVLPEREGLSVFFKDGDNIYHTYSTYARGLDVLLGTYHYLDLTPKGRDEKSGMDWVKRHDKY